MTSEPSKLKLDILLSPTVRARQWRAEVWTWRKLVRRLTQGPVADQKECGLWAAIAVREGMRRIDSLETRSAIVLDIDRATGGTLLDLQLALGEYEYVITTTFSSTEASPRYRVVVPLDEKIAGADSRLLTAYLAREMCGLAGEMDALSLDPVHAMYWPAERPGSGTYQSWHNSGALLPTAETLELARDWEVDHPQEKDGAAAYGYDGPSYDELNPVRQELARLRTHALVEEQAAYLEGLLTLEEGEVDRWGHGWESGNLTVVARLMRLAGSTWSPLSLEEAQEAYYRALPEAMRLTEPSCDKWRPGDYDRVIEKYGALIPPWDDVPFSPIDDDESDGDDGSSGGSGAGGGQKAKPSKGSSSNSGAAPGSTAGRVARGVLPAAPTDTVPVALRWLREEAGQRGLADLFLHNDGVVLAPRVVEAGASDEELAVRRVDADLMMNVLHTRYRPVSTGRNGAPKDADSFRRQAVQEWLADPADSAHLPVLRRVVRHPLFRADGTWLATPGYDARSGLLYLPSGLAVPPVAVRPGEDDLAGARLYLDAVLGDFPWASPDDRANYLAFLITPLVMEMFPAPYMFALFTAPQAGSGKSLLAEILRAVYGGSFRADLFKSGEEEVRKYITSALQVYDGPIMHIDNLSGNLSSPLFDSLLTSPVWADRLLGSSKQVSLRNDRLWIGTGNNVRVAGDTRRRTLQVRIDPGQERPQERTAFFVQGMRGWIKKGSNRSRLIQAAAVLVAHWVAEGMPVPEVESADGYENWIAGMRGIVECAELGEEYGVVGNVDWSSDVVLADDEETQERWDFYSALYRVFGTDRWRAQQVVQNLGGRISVDALPDHVRLAFVRGTKSMGRVIGGWLGKHGDTWAEGLALKRLDLKAGNATWWVIQATDDATRRIQQEIEVAEFEGNVVPFRREHGSVESEGGTRPAGADG